MINKTNHSQQQVGFGTRFIGLKRFVTKNPFINEKDAGDILKLAKEAKKDRIKALVWLRREPRFFRPDDSPFDSTRVTPRIIGGTIKDSLAAIFEPRTTNTRFKTTDISDPVQIIRDILKEAGQVVERRIQNKQAQRFKKQKERMKAGIFSKK